MSTPSPATRSPRRGSGSKAGLVITILVVVGAVAFFSMRGMMKKEESKTEFYTVTRAPLTVSITEGGALRAVREATIRSEFAGTPRIIFIVPEGTYVTNGQKLVEFETADLKDTVNAQEISYQTALFNFTQATNQLIVTKSQQESFIKSAELNVEFAASDLEKYKDGDAPQAMRVAQANLLLNQEDLARASEKYSNTVELLAKGFQMKTAAESERLSLARMKLNIETGSNNLRLLTTYDQPKALRRLELSLENLTATLARTKQQSLATIAQADSSLRTQQRSLDLTKSQLDDKRTQLERAIIYAPQAGLVVYASSSTGGTGGGGGGQTLTSLIEEGATVRQNQNIIKLPDVSEMLVDVSVHESHVLQVHPKLRAYVTIDSIPDQQFNAEVLKVAVLPSSQASTFNPNLKVYSTQVLITDKLPDLKPGVSAKAEIIITNLPSVLQVPIQAVTTIKGKQVVYLDKGTPNAVPVPVIVGFFNERFIEIKQGLAEGDRVLLSPPSGGEDLESTESTTTAALPGSGGAVAASIPAAESAK